MIMSKIVELAGSTGLLNTYTSGDRGGKITVRIHIKSKIEYDIYLDFEEPDGVEVYDVTGAIQHNDKWKLLRTSDGYVREITFWFRRSSNRDEIKKQEITVCALSNNNIIDDIMFMIEG